MDLKKKKDIRDIPSSDERIVCIYLMQIACFNRLINADPENYYFQNRRDNLAHKAANIWHQKGSFESEITMESLNLLYRNVSIEEFGYILSGKVVNAEGALGFPAVNVENGNGLKDGRAIFGWVGKNDQHKPYSSIQLTLKNIDLKSIGVASYIWTNQSTYDSGVYEYPEAHFNNYSWDNVKEVTIETFSELKSIIDRLNFDRLYLDDCSFYPENYWANFTQANLEEYYSERNMDNDSCRVEPNAGSILQAIRYLHQQFSLKIIDLELVLKLNLI